MRIDVRVAELLCSRLCHDLIGPVGAVNAGLELLREGGDNEAGALDLVGRSAGQMARRLEFFRAAFGLGAHIEGASPLARARELARGLLAEGNVRLEWPDRAVPAPESRLPVGSGKLVLNVILVGVDSLPRGGALTVHLAESVEGAGLVVTASGRGAAVRADLRAALERDASVEELSARTVHGHLARLLAEAIGATLEVTPVADGEVRLALLLPFAAVEAPAGGRRAAAKRIV